MVNDLATAGWDDEMLAGLKQSTSKAKPKITFHVHEKWSTGKWKFWMFARGKSVKQVIHSIWWHNKGRIKKEDIRAFQGDIPSIDDHRPLAIS